MRDSSAHICGLKDSWFAGAPTSRSAGPSSRSAGADESAAQRIAESDMIMFHMWPMDGARGRTRMNTWKDLGLAPYIVVWGDERRFAGTS